MEKELLLEIGDKKSGFLIKISILYIQTSEKLCFFLDEKLYNVVNLILVKHVP